MDTGHFHFCNHQKWLPYQILGGKTVKNVQIDPQQRRYDRKAQRDANLKGGESEFSTQSFSKKIKKENNRCSRSMGHIGLTNRRPYSYFTFIISINYLFFII